ncbi:MAG: hypothetical protein WBD05_02060 [Phycisphaerae bacterium]
MKDRRGSDRPAARGVALLLTLIFLALFVAMAVAIAASADINLTIARNRIESRQAAALAETGLLLCQRHLGGLQVPATSDIEDLHEAIANHIAAAWDASSMADATDLTWDANSAVLPTVMVTQEGRSGTIDATVTANGGVLSSPTVTIQSTGRFGNAVRTVSYRMAVVDTFSVLSKYGVISKSRLRMTGNGKIEGANQDAEGSVLSATYSHIEAIDMGGHSSVSGDAAVSNLNAQIIKSDSASIGGDQIYGVMELPWPEIDVSIFEPYATNIYTGNSGGGKDKGKKDKDDGDDTLTNIRIPAGTNPTFNANTTISGVLYIESPNVVTFNGSATISGVIVAEQPEIEDLSTNQIHFGGNVTSSGVENLPPDSEFDGLRELTGSFLLAPGFSTKFRGNSSMLSGWIVASSFDFAGNVSAAIRGGVMNLNDSNFLVSGNLTMTIDKANVAGEPAGMVAIYVLACVPGSYEE